MASYIVEEEEFCMNHNNTRVLLEACAIPLEWLHIHNVYRSLLTGDQDLALADVSGLRRLSCLMGVDSPWS